MPALQSHGPVCIHNKLLIAQIKLPHVPRTKSLFSSDHQEYFASSTGDLETRSGHPIPWTDNPGAYIASSLLWRLAVQIFCDFEDGNTSKFSLVAYS